MHSARLALLIVALAAGACGDGEPKLPGTSLGGQPAADFRLTDAEGRTVSLSEFKGRVVALTFLYTECPDVCPVIAQRLGQALAELGKDAGKVGVLVVSVDPEGDTPASAHAFMQRHGLSGPGRHYLLGDVGTLAPVWLAYGVGSVAIASGERAPGAPQQFGRIGHTDVIYLIDRDGRKQTLLRGDATAAEIARGLRTLLR